MELLVQDPSEMGNPGLKYMAASRLAASDSRESLDLLISVCEKDSDDLFERITRRKAIDALGRRKNAKAIEVLLNALTSTDEPTVVNAASAIARIDVPLGVEERGLLLKALLGPDNQKRAVIQAHTRLKIKDTQNAIKDFEKDENPLVAGAACAYGVRIEGRTELLKPLIAQLNDDNAGRRRSAVIDLGDAGSPDCLDALARAPVSMPLRAKSAFEIVELAELDQTPGSFDSLLEQLLEDNPTLLDLSKECECSEDPGELEQNFQHRDEAKQYGAARTLMQMQPSSALEIIDDLKNRLGSDYGIHYLLTSCVGLMKLEERSDIIRSSLAQTDPQYTKSRIAAVWGCLNLELRDQVPHIEALAGSAGWVPLKWSCRRVLKVLSQ